jgi:hypothetical protein
MESAIRARFVPDSFQNLSRDLDTSQIETKAAKTPRFFVIASAAKQSILPCCPMDCFAVLAMTVGRQCTLKETP